MPLTLEDDEWNEVGIQHNEDSQVKVYQNNRAYNVFKEADKFDGKPYCIDGPNGEVVTLEEYPRVYFGDFRTAKEIEEQNKKRREKVMLLKRREFEMVSRQEIEKRKN